MTGPPQAPRQPREHREHGVTRADPYHWLRELDGRAVRAHLAAERSWYDTATGHLTPLVATLQAEMVERVASTDSSVSWRLGTCSYYTRVPVGREYPQLVRELNLPDTGGRPARSVAPPAAEQPHADPHILLDLNDVAGDSDYAELSHLMVSPDERLLAYSVDLVGDEVYRLRFRDLDTGRDLADEVPRCYYGGAWSADSRHFFYTVHDAAYRPYRVFRHEVGTAAVEDALVLQEDDERFELLVRGSRSGGLVVIWARSRDTTETWVVDAREPTTPARSVGGRRPGVEYHAEHLATGGGEELLVVTNDAAAEFRLVRAPVPRQAGQDHTAWRGVRDEVPVERLERVDAFADRVVLSYRTEGETRLRVLTATDLTAEGTVVRPAYPCGAVRLGPNRHFAARTVSVADSSYLHPTVWSDLDPETEARVERHRQQAPGHDPARYVVERRHADAPDGTPVPATLVRHRNTPLDGSAPALIYGYGAYEAVDDPAWDPALPSLLDRGVVYVHAHVRGGGEQGRRWWLEGRLSHKQNTFSDYAAVADGLAGDLGGPPVVDGSRLATRGLSAGGLLQGAVFSQRPDRWRAVVAEVPFVDVVSTMFDASIPLTVNEWDEWGDPRREREFRWLLAYSPYENLPPAGGRPDLLVTGALHDPRVMVWEPAKWVAALRHSDPAWSPRCLFRVETGAGAHVGPSGRYAHLGYEAEVYAWVLDRLEVAAADRVDAGPGVA